MNDPTPFLTLAPAPQAVLDGAERHPERARFMLPDADGGWTPVTWAEHAADLRRCARWLIAHDLRREEPVAIFADNRVDWLAAALGIQAAGGAMVPIYPASTGAQAAYVLRHAGVRVLFVDGEAQIRRLADTDGALDTVAHVIVFDPALASLATGLLGADKVIAWADVLAQGADLDGDGVLDARLAGVDLDHIGLILYTSGSTGQPKGVPLTHRNTAANGRDWIQCNAPLLSGDGEDVDLLWLPFSHVFGFGEACLGNVLGFTSWLSSPRDALDRLPDVRPTVFMSVPAYWDKLATRAAGDPDALRRITGGRLRFCLSGGAGLAIPVKEAFLAAGMLIIEGYGLTESSPTLTLNRPDDYRFDSVGKPLPSVELRLADDGEIQARGPNVFGGYLHDPDATRGAFTDDGWLETGDLGRFTDDGFLQIVGRKKEILVTAGGKNVPPANVEACFGGDPLIAHVVVYGDARPCLVAGFWPEPVAVAAWLAERGLSEDDAEAALTEHLAARVAAVNATLARYEAIKRFRVFVDRPLTVDDGHLTSTLKLRRHQIARDFGADLDALYD